jgi:DNA polymerase I
MQKTLFLLDGHALVYRAHYAFISRPLINTKGFDTSAINGFTRTLWDLIQQQKPTHIAVSFDLPGGTFRNQMFSEYKANRDAQPEQITAALPYIFKIIEGMNIPILVKQNYEADDVIGTIAKKAEKEGFRVFMVTPDKDYGQLVSPNVFMYKPGRKGDEVEVWGEKEVCENWNIKNVSQVIDILGLQGDAVDNIPGVPGIGPKTAATLLEKYGSVEGVIANAHELKGKQKESVEQFAEQAILSKQLATIDIDVPIAFDEEALRVSPVNVEILTEIFKELEFRSIATQILGVTQSSSKPTMPTNTATATSSSATMQMDLFGNPVPVQVASQPAKQVFTHVLAEKNITNTSHNYHLIETAGQRAALAQKLSEQTEISFDTETTNIDATQADLVGLSFAFSEHEGYYVPVPAEKTAAQAVVNDFKYVFENKDIIKIGQNIKYDAIVLRSYGVQVEGILFDTMLAHYLLEPELRHNMNYMAETLLGYAPIEIDTLIGAKGKNQGNMRDVAPEKVKDYAAEDADITLQLKNVLAPKLKEYDELEKIFYDFETPLVRVLAAMEAEGIRIDGQFLEQYAEILQAKIEILEKKVIEQAGVNFNVASPKQVGGILFDIMKIPYKGGKTKSGQYSTDEDVMSELAKTYPIAADILAYRGVSKLKSTYVDALPKMINPRTGRVHSNFNQALTATGRLSSNNPNLQNIPIKTPEGSEVRKAFVPRDENHVLISADYSQIELRLIAEISNDESMIEAFQSGNDFHRATAAKIYNVDFDAVTAEQRRNAKTVNFSITYGAGAQNLSQQLGIPRAEAKVLVDAYREQFKGLRNYMVQVVEKAREDGYVKTLLGRRRYLRDIDSRNALARTNAERMAINTPIQGTAADMIKIAMVNIYNALKNNNLQTKLVLQVHDELVFDVPKNEVDIVKNIIEKEMKNAIPSLRVPIEVGIGEGNNWLEAH